MIGIFFTLANDCNFFIHIVYISSTVENLIESYITYGLEISIVAIAFITGFFYNKNFPFEVIDYSKTDILLKNIYQFFSDLPVT